MSNGLKAETLNVASLLNLFPTIARFFQRECVIKVNRQKNLKREDLPQKEALIAVIKALNVNKEFKNSALNYPPTW